MIFRLFFGGVATWFGRGTSMVLGLVLMPILFRQLSKPELGVWLLLGQSWAALSILDFGLGAILTRRVAFAVAKSENAREFYRAELADVLATGHRVYAWLGLIAFALSIVGGALYLRSVELPGNPVGLVWIAWSVLCLSQAFGIWAAPWTCLLQGLGYVGWDTILACVVNSVTLILQITTVLVGGGLMGLAIVAAAGTIFQRLVIIRFIKSRAPDLDVRQGRYKPHLLREMIPPSVRSWVTSLGYLLVANTDQFFVAAYAGASALPAYRAAILLVINLHFLAGVFSSASPVFVSQLWQEGDLEAIHAILRRNARIGLWAMGCGAAVILALGPTLFELWLGAGNFIGYPVLALFLITFILEHHANVFSTCARATGDEAYAASSIATGILKLLLAWVLTARFGLIGLASATLAAQASGNAWFMVYRSVRRLQVGFRDHLKEVVYPCLCLFSAALAAGFLVNQVVHSAGARVVLVAGGAGVMLAGALWQLALTPSERSCVLRRLRLV